MWLFSALKSVQVVRVGLSQVLGLLEGVSGDSLSAGSARQALAMARSWGGTSTKSAALELVRTTQALQLLVAELDTARGTDCLLEGFRAGCLHHVSQLLPTGPKQET